MKKTADQNKADGKKFLQENAKKPGVKTLPDGLQYKAIMAGTGRKPKDTDLVLTNYRGRKSLLAFSSIVTEKIKPAWCLCLQPQNASALLVESVRDASRRLKPQKRTRLRR